MSDWGVNPYRLGTLRSLTGQGLEAMVADVASLHLSLAQRMSVL
jgi:hypothetical protein